MQKVVAKYDPKSPNYVIGWDHWVYLSEDQSGKQTQLRVDLFRRWVEGRVRALTVPDYSSLDAYTNNLEFDKRDGLRRHGEEIWACYAVTFTTEALATEARMVLSMLGLDKSSPPS